MQLNCSTGCHLSCSSGSASGEGLHLSTITLWFPGPSYSPSGRSHRTVKKQPIVLGLKWSTHGVRTWSLVLPYHFHTSSYNVCARDFEGHKLIYKYRMNKTIVVGFIGIKWTTQLSFFFFFFNQHIINKIHIESSITEKSSFPTGCSIKVYL